MVAITATLATVFGSSLFEMRGDMKGPDIVLATASMPAPDQIVVTYYGGPDHDLVDDDSDSGNASAIAGVAPGYTLAISDPGDTVANNGIANLNGGNLTITSDRDHVVVTAAFSDDSTQVILNTYV